MAFMIIEKLSIPVTGLLATFMLLPVNGFFWEEGSLWIFWKRREYPLATHFQYSELNERPSLHRPKLIGNPPRYNKSNLHPIRHAPSQLGSSITPSLS
jgi:hypothetical protein